MTAEIELVGRTRPTTWSDVRGRRRLLVAAFALFALPAIPSVFAQSDAKTFKPEELDQILAPIALYPDALLSQVVMASTYPLEVVEAARWSKANPAFKGDAAVTAVADKNWDVSVKSLVAFPQILAQMDEHLDWTQKLGDALLAQQEDVAKSIQRLRAQAAAAGNLESSSQQKVTVEGSGDDRMYVIEPTNPQVIYVPAYNPTWAYGTWPYAAYPPVYYPPPPAYYGSALLRGFMWGVGFAAAGAMFGGWNWRGGGNNYVNINASRAVNIDRNFNVNGGGGWRHDPSHRKGVSYRDNMSRDRYGQNRPGAEQRQPFRGQTGGPGNAGAARPGGPQAAQRPVQGGPANARPGAGQPRAATQPAQRGGGALNGVDRGQQVNREAQRGRNQQQRAAPQQRPAGGGGGAAPAQRPTGGGGGGGGAPAPAQRPAGGAGAAAGGGGGRR